VRGIMMLTSETALHLGIDDRSNAQQSIVGAAKYLASLRDSLPPSVTEPDRSWMALAAYNIGTAHLLDARELTRKRGGNADLWQDVRKTLPLLTRSNWYTMTPHGQARGGETVIFVANVRAYYDILAWSDNNTATPDPAVNPGKSAGEHPTPVVGRH
jgi:membrane-bound lytic murein transglycosylase MltF